MAPPFTLTLLLGDAEVVHRGQADGGEGLVDLEEVDVADRLARLAQRLGDGPGRLVQQRRVGAGDLAVADQLAERGQRRAASALAGDMTTTAAPPSEICEALPAVIVPALSKAGRSAASDSAVVPGRTPSSVSTSDRVALALGDLHRDDLVGEPARP